MSDIPCLNCGAVEATHCDGWHRCRACEHQWFDIPRDSRLAGLRRIRQVVKDNFTSAKTELLSIDLTLLDMLVDEEEQVVTKLNTVRKNLREKRGWRVMRVFIEGGVCIGRATGYEVEAGVGDQVTLRITMKSDNASVLLLAEAVVQHTCVCTATGGGERLLNTDCPMHMSGMVVRG